MTETLIVAILGSSALAALISGGFSLILYFVQKRDKKKDASTRMILGLGHETIVELGLEYIKQGYVTDVQYNDLIKYLYEPYEALGGNGTAEKIINEVKKLPIRAMEEVKHE